MKKVGNYKNMNYVAIIIISLLFIILLGSIDAEESINLEYREVVEPSEEFDLIINFNDFPKSSYDLKVEIKEGNSNIAEKYWEGEWKSTYYWIYDAIDTNNAESLIISLKINEGFIGDYEIIVKVKDGIEREFTGNHITVREIVEGENEEDNDPDNTNEAYFEISWDEDDIINGEDFDIIVKGFNLEDRDYNLKLWIEKEDESVIISDRYDENEDGWKSGRYYLNEIISGPGEIDETIKVRIKDSYKDYSGDSKIFLKSNDNDILLVEEDIEILETEEESKDEKDEVIESIEKESENKDDVKAKVREASIVQGNVIRLNSVKEISKEVNENENEDVDIEKETDNEEIENTELVYESDNEIIKKYSIYGFTILLALFTVLLIFNKL